MKLSVLHVGIGTCLSVALLSIASNASAAFSPEFYEQRRLAQQQVQADQFDRLHSGATDDGIIWRDTGKRTTGKAGKGTIIKYVIEEKVVMPPLTDTGPALNAALLLASGCAIGGWYVRKRCAA